MERNQALLMFQVFPALTTRKMFHVSLMFQLFPTPAISECVVLQTLPTPSWP